MSQPKTKKTKKTPIAEAPSAPVPVATVSRETLEETPERTLSLLRAIGTSRAIRALMAAYGYDAEDHKEGWALVHGVSGFTPDEPLETVDTRVRDAIVTLDNWDEAGFRLVRATLTRLYPEQAAFVLDGIGPSVGTAAVLGVKTLLQRLDALEKSPARKATRKADHAALARLAKSGLDAKERARLADLVKTAESVSDAPGADDEKAREERDEAHVQALTALRAWYEEWSELARIAVKRRDYLIRMGLATRKAPAKKDEGEAKAKDDAEAEAKDDAPAKPTKKADANGKAAAEAASAPK
ncbi:MAG: hypothetical protein QM820_51870 [Minicystis sp.]